MVKICLATLDLYYCLSTKSRIENFQFHTIFISKKLEGPDGHREQSKYVVSITKVIGIRIACEHKNVTVEKCVRNAHK